MIYVMDLEYSSGLMEIDMKDYGKKISEMDKEF